MKKYTKEQIIDAYYKWEIDVRDNPDNFIEQLILDRKNKTNDEILESAKSACETLEKYINQNK